jgi:MtrB/PioB family decaheme-associated outer membrane protein
MTRNLTRPIALLLCCVGAASAAPAQPVSPIAMPQSSIVAADHRYVVNLESSTRPLTVPPLRELSGAEQYVVYTSRFSHDGHTWNRLRIGFFASRGDAQRVLNTLKERYPQAWIAPATDQEVAEAVTQIENPYSAAEAVGPTLAAAVEESRLQLAQALDAAEPVKGGKSAVAAPAVSTLSSETYELGVGYVSDDAYRFGRYTGLQDEGPYAVGEITARGYRSDGGYWRARGTDLGLDSRYLRVEGGWQGRQEYFIEYAELPNNDSDSARTPFQDVGNANLTLPAGFDIDQNLEAALHPFEIETNRTRLGLGAGFITRSPWTVDISYHRDSKEGTGRIGGASSVGGNPGAGLLVNTTATLLPEPVNYETNLVDVTLHYVKNKAQLDLAYHMSLFQNDDRALTWQNPFSPASTSSQALAPDNELHRLTLTGGYLLPYKSRVTGVLSVGRMTQNENFEPYAFVPGPGGADLPRDSLDGEVWLTTAHLKLLSRPQRKLRLDAALRYDERNSDTPVDTYEFVGRGPIGTQPVANNPLSFKRYQADLGANYRIRSDMSLRGDYKYDRMSRDYQDEERDRTEENTLSAKWKLQPHATVDLALYAEAGRRDGSNYRVPEGENPALRKYYLADRDRTRVGTSVDYLPSDTLSIAAGAAYTEDDYRNSDIGLTEATQPTYTLEVSYRPRQDTTTYASFTREDIRSRQAGSEAGTSFPDWKADFDDTVNTYGAGARITGIGAKWDVGADLVYTDSSGDIDMKNLVPGGEVTPYPDLKTELTSVKLWTLYHYRKDLALRLTYWYEKYSADNWALDGVQENSVPGLLLFGEDTQDYDVHAVSASALFQF